VGTWIIFVLLIAVGKKKHDVTLQAKWPFSFRILSLKAEMMT
jgi:hypothetical protein